MDDLPARKASALPRLRLRPFVAAGTVWLPEHARDAILADTVQKDPQETGGILLGYEVPDDLAVVITDLIGPGPKASYSRDEFEPDGLWQEREVARIYGSSGRRTTYLGDWHSHPSGSSIPSRKDHRTARIIAHHKPARMRRPLMLIVGSDDEDWRIAAFRLTRRKLRPMQLTLSR